MAVLWLLVTMVVMVEPSIIFGDSDAEFDEIDENDKGDNIQTYSIIDSPLVSETNQDMIREKGIVNNYFSSNYDNNNKEDENDAMKSDEERDFEMNNPTEENDNVEITFNMTSTLEWSVQPGDRTFSFEREGCKERTELDFDNLISGTATRDGVWTSQGKFVSADVSKRCPLDGTCFGTQPLFSSITTHSFQLTHSHTHTTQTMHLLVNTMQRCQIVHVDSVSRAQCTHVRQYLQKS
jgi:hypothetical protein